MPAELAALVCRVSAGAVVRRAAKLTAATSSSESLQSHIGVKEVISRFVALGSKPCQRSLHEA